MRPKLVRFIPKRTEPPDYTAQMFVGGYFTKLHPTSALSHWEWQLWPDKCNRDYKWKAKTDQLPLLEVSIKCKKTLRYGWQKNVKSRHVHNGVLFPLMTHTL